MLSAVSGRVHGGSRTAMANDMSDRPHPAGCSCRRFALSARPACFPIWRLSARSGPVAALQDFPNDCPSAPQCRRTDRAEAGEDVFSEPVLFAVRTLFPCFTQSGYAAHAKVDTHVRLQGAHPVRIATPAAPRLTLRRAAKFSGPAGLEIQDSFVAWRAGRVPSRFSRSSVEHQSLLSAIAWTRSSTA